MTQRLKCIEQSLFQIAVCVEIKLAEKKYRYLDQIIAALCDSSAYWCARMTPLELGIGINSVPEWLRHFGDESIS